MTRNTLVIAAGKMALVFVIWASIVVGLYYLTFVGPKGLPIYFALPIYLALVGLTGNTCFRTIWDMFKKSKGITLGSQSDWIQLVTILGAAFAVGAAFQAVSTIDAQTVSNSACVRPPGLNVTSPNCAQVQTLTQTQGPFTSLGLLGVWMVVLGATAAVVFGILYVLRRLEDTPIEFVD